MALGGIGGAIAANAICVRMEEERIEEEKRYGHKPPSDNSMEYAHRDIEKILDETNYQTLEDKRNHLIKMQYAGIAFIDKETTKIYNYVISDMIRDINFKLEEQKESSYKYKIF